MKKMKRLVAVLLAGIMVLTMLTACGGNSKSFAQQVEEAYMKNVNASMSENSKLKNDPALRNRAMAMLNKIDENGMIATKDAVYFDVSVSSNKQSVTLILATQIDSVETNGKVPAIEVTAADLKKMQNSTDDSDIDLDGEITAAGIAAKTMANGKTYVAAGVTYTRKN